jgi:hypothetical protein
MKKFIQISLVVVLAFVLAYGAFVGSVDAASQAGSSGSSSLSSTADTSTEVVLTLGCRSSRSGIPCALPNVGWNS